MSHTEIWEILRAMTLQAIACYIWYQAGKTSEYYKGWKSGADFVIDEFKKLTEKEIAKRKGEKSCTK